MTRDDVRSKLVEKVRRMRHLQKIVFRSIHDANFVEMMRLETEVDALLDLEALTTLPELPPIPAAAAAELPELPELPDLDALPEVPPL